MGELITDISGWGIGILYIILFNQWGAVGENE
jgi:hypothetical protein